jgi:hypothetical protein
VDIELPPILRKYGASIPSWQTGPLLLCHQFVDEAPMLHGLLDCLPVVKNPGFVWFVCLFWINVGGKEQVKKSGFGLMRNYF